MIYQVDISDEAMNNIRTHLKAGNKKLVTKIATFINELSQHPRSATGKPEQLKGFGTETWSRRIDSKHRLIYEIRESELIVTAISAYGHYGNR